ncbi:MAG: hypothetical protein RL026_139 [Pseudomonadota bacterium]|jgi:iron complex outermembrane receptor protein
MNRRIRLVVSFIISAAPLLGQAQQAPSDAADLEYVTVTGTRAAPRSAVESLVPVDVISADMVKETASAELVETLASLVPSFNVQTLPALDATIFVRPARLRNLSPDHTLVLVNGKRMHRSAMMANPSYGISFQAPDLSQIPNSALKSIDVLREGAAAQYGSDAIAGVINLNLDDSEGLRGFALYGQQYEGDGEGPRFGVHGGLRNDAGFVAATVEYSDTSFTSRSRQSSNAAASQAAYPDRVFPDPDVRWGKPDREALRFAFTSGLEVDSTSFYAFGTWGEGEGRGDFNYRGPVGAYASVFRTSTAFPGWNLLSLYPTGFTPVFGSRDFDSSIVMGGKTVFGNGLTLDLSAGYGRNRIDYFMEDSINASLGPDSPTSFEDGGVRQVEVNLNADASLPLEFKSMAEPVVLAFGAERREEKFSILPGDPASYAFGPGARGTPALPCCSNGFPGYSPVVAGTWSQVSKAAYLDVTLPVTPSWELAAAARYEDFDTFGDSLTWKLSTRYQLPGGLALRGTASTGFRAPTPAQTYSEGLSQFLPNAAASITTAGRFSPVGPVAQVLNKRDGVAILPLEPEESRSLSLGLVWDSDFGLQATFDLFNVEIDNRLNTSTTYVLTAAENAELAALQIPNLQDIAQANFLQNDYDTRTRGAELVASYARPVGAGTLNASLAFSHIDTTITGGSRALNPYSKQMTEDSLPKSRATAQLAYRWSDFTITARGRYYGSWSDWTDAFPTTAQNTNPALSTYRATYAPQVFSAMTFIDLIVGYEVNDRLSLRVGAENLFDSYPDKAQWQTFRGLIYSRNSPYSTDGGYVFGRIDWRLR